MCVRVREGCLFVPLIVEVEQVRQVGAEAFRFEFGVRFIVRSSGMEILRWVVFGVSFVRRNVSLLLDFM